MSETSGVTNSMRMPPTGGFGSIFILSIFLIGGSVTVRSRSEGSPDGGQNTWVISQEMCGSPDCSCSPFNISHTFINCHCQGTNQVRTFGWKNLLRLLSFNHGHLLIHSSMETNKSTFINSIFIPTWLLVEGKMERTQGMQGLRATKIESE
jgi:hypothetical protein